MIDIKAHGMQGRHKCIYKKKKGMLFIWTLDSIGNKNKSFNSGKEDNLLNVRIYMVRNNLFNCSICFAREITRRIAVFS